MIDEVGGTPRHVLFERTAADLQELTPELLCGLALAGASRASENPGGASGILTAEELATLDLTQCELAVL